MEEKKWQTLRESGFRVFFVGFFSLIIAFVIYSRLTMPSSELLRIESQELTGLAWGMLAITAASMASMAYGTYVIFRSEYIRTSSSPTNSLISFITGVFSDRNYWKIMILAAIVSLLVGFNVALSIFAFRLKKSLQTKTSLAAGIGATSGLFVGCPTCAGSLISALLGIGIAGAGGTSASVLAPFQTLFIAASIPALVVAPFLIGRSIRSASSCNIT